MSFLVFLIFQQKKLVNKSKDIGFIVANVGLDLIWLPNRQPVFEMEQKFE